MNEQYHVFRLKMLFGFTLLLGLEVLGLAISLGKVEEATSFGLTGIIKTLEIMTAAFCGWMAGHHASKPEKDETP